MKKQMMKTALVIGTILAAQAQAQAAEYTLRFAHFFPAVASAHEDIVQVWADKVGKESDGRIEVDIYPSSTLSKPPAQYDAVVNKIADLTLTVQGYTANRFPLTQIVELPGISKNAVNGSCIVQGLYDEGLIAKEYEKTHPLFMFTHGPGNIHTSEKLIKTPEDLEGLRIRRPTAVIAKLLEGLGAQPVGMPAPSSYESLQRGVIDGVTLPWEGQLTFRLNELATKHTEVGGLYTVAFLVTMNKDTYNKMPKDLQQVIDNNSGAEWANLAAEVFDGLDVKGRQQAKDLGHEIYTVEGGANNPAWKPILDKATKEYITSLEDKGLPAKKVYARALELSESCPI
jgi:TRAP-type C4-dicarboxylate transport system substrate-binding protein